MRREQSTTDEIKSSECPECGSSIRVRRGNKEYCGNCDYLYGEVFSPWGARSTRVNGHKRDSKLEASVEIDLATRKAAGDIKDYDTQYQVVMPIYRADGAVVGYVNHKVDFRVHLKDGDFELLEAKGRETIDYKWRRTLLESVWLPEHPDYEYKVIKQTMRKPRR